MKRKIFGLILVIGILSGAGCTAGFLNHKMNLPAYEFNQAFFELSKETNPTVFYIKDESKKLTFYLSGKAVSKFFRQGEWKFYLVDRTGIIASDYVYVMDSFGKIEATLKGSYSSQYILYIAKASLDGFVSVNIWDLPLQSRMLISGKDYVNSEGEISVPIMHQLIWGIPFTVEKVGIDQEEKLCHEIVLNF